MKARFLVALFIALGAMTSCGAPRSVELLGSARITSDFHSYTLQRVGVLPFRALNAKEAAAHEIGTIEGIFHAEFANETSFDLIPLRHDDLAELPAPDPFRAGWYTPETINELRSRYRLDALLVGTITSRRTMPPQVLGMQLDLVSTETGQTLWTSDLLLDANSGTTRRELEHWAATVLDEAHGARMALLSPKKFAQFAAFQMARLL